MAKGKRIAAVIISVAAAAAVGIGGFTIWKKKGGGSADGEVYVMPVSEVNTVSGLSLSGNRFSGVIETQKTEDYKFDSSKKVDSIKVKVGDVVKPGDILFTYDVEAMQLEYDQGKIDVERMENEIEMNKLEIEELEKEKATSNQDGQISLNTQILSLESDNAKAEYDIKAKKAENKKLKKAIKNAQVVCETEGTVKSIAEIDTLEMSENNVVVSISKGDEFIIKGTVNEQMIQNIYIDMPVVIRSRVDENAVWTGSISEIETNPQKNNEDMYYDEEGDSSTSSSKYAFYIQADSIEGLMLGQHIIIEPDNGSGTTIEKKGIWLYKDYIFEENGKSYVWAKGDKNKIEKREVKIGQTDEAVGDCEILKGLSKDDFIAYPDANIKEGMKITDKKKDNDIPEEDYNEQMNGADDMFIPEDDFGGEDFADEEFMEEDFTEEDFMDEGFDEGEMTDEEAADEEIIE